MPAYRGAMSRSGSQTMHVAATNDVAIEMLPVSASDRPAWCFMVLAEITNFAALRRHLGCARADLLTADVVSRIAAALPDARLSAASRSVVELTMECAEASYLDRVLERLRQLCDAPFDLDGEEHKLNAVFGAAVGRACQMDDVRLVEEAEAALLEARGADSAVKHDVAGPGARELRRLGDELRVAIDENQLLLLYQPKVHVRRQEIGSAEALVRWRHPERGLVLPGDFIAAAENGGVIDLLTLWTIRQAIVDQRRLSAAGHDLRIFINISGQLLADNAFVDAACRLVAEADAKLGFEVTETSVIRDPQSAIANLQRFADIGIIIAIDDYGAGLSSLAYLKQLPARELKIDKLFVTQLTSSNRDPLIVRSTIDLAHALEMEVVAEGVETHAALALLTVMGCDMVQGFLISRPIAVEALMTYLEEDRHHQAPEDTRASFNRLATAWKRG